MRRRQRYSAEVGSADGAEQRAGEHQIEVGAGVTMMALLPPSSRMLHPGREATTPPTILPMRMLPVAGKWGTRESLVMNSPYLVVAVDDVDYTFWNVLFSVAPRRKIF